MTLIPEMRCREGCADCCGPVPFSPAEVAKLEASQPFRVFRWIPFGTHFILEEATETLKCPLVTDDNKCGAYEARPLVCRLFGVVDHPRMTCHWGHGSTAKLTNAQAKRILETNP